MKDILEIENNSMRTLLLQCTMKWNHNGTYTAKGKQILWKTSKKATANGLKRLGHEKYNNICNCNFFITFRTDERANFLKLNTNPDKKSENRNCVIQTILLILR